jgi:hypothetical protein
MIFVHFRQKGTCTGAETIQCVRGSHIEAGGGRGAFAPPVYMLKKTLLFIKCTNSHIVKKWQSNDEYSYSFRIENCRRIPQFLFFTSYFSLLFLQSQ